MILENVSTDIPAGQLMAIIGSSGSGKVYDLVSDLLKALIADMFADIHVECYGPPHARSES
jgi:ABC-type phosphate/phosphonate transport system ATPase subunit